MTLECEDANSKLVDVFTFRVERSQPLFFFVPHSQAGSTTVREGCHPSPIDVDDEDHVSKSCSLEFVADLGGEVRS